MKMKQYQATDHGSSLFVGPSAPEQKPKPCSRCGKPVVLAYRVYSRERIKNSDPPEYRITKGQFEVAHVIDNKPIFDICPYPSLLEQLQSRINQHKTEEENRRPDLAEKKTVHLETQTASGGVRVWCGARGSLWTTLDRQSVTCSNCKVRLETDNRIGQSNQTKEKTDMSTQQGAATGAAPKMTAADIKAKIAASKAKKAEGQTQGTAANLVSDDEGPLPQATGAKVKKQQVQATAKTKEPKTLNLCGCGCGTPVKSSFAPGHDAKLHGWIKKLAAGKMLLTELPVQVISGMYPKVKQQFAIGEDKSKIPQGVEPVCDEKDYLETLKGKGGLAE